MRGLPDGVYRCPAGAGNRSNTCLGRVRVLEGVQPKLSGVFRGDRRLFHENGTDRGGLSPGVSRPALEARRRVRVPVLARAGGQSVGHLGALRARL